MVRPEAYYSRPIALRHPVVFYEGHLPAFSLNTLVKKALGRPGVDERLERLFARGIDPEDEASASRSQRAMAIARRGPRFADECDALILEALANAPLEQPGHPLLHEAQAVYAILEHEAMHQETMLYMWHQLPHEQKHGAGRTAQTRGDEPGGGAGHGPGRPRDAWRTPGEIPFGWDNEFPGLRRRRARLRDRRPQRDERAVHGVRRCGRLRQAEWWTPEACAWVRQERSSIRGSGRATNGTWQWHGMFEEIALPPAWPVYVSQAEAAAYARWKGARLPTEAEYHRAAFGKPSGDERQYPWGDAAPDASRGLFDFAILESCRRRIASCGPKRLGRARSDGKRMGVDVHRVRAVRRIPADGFLSRVLSRLFRRPAHGDERGFARDSRASCCDAAFATGSARTTRTSTPPSAACGRSSSRCRTPPPGASSGRSAADRRRANVHDERLAISPRLSASTCS